MEVNLTVEALKFMALGMGIVFTFLLIMVGVLKLQASLIAKFFPEKPVATPKPAPQKAQTTTNDSKKIAAIVAAVQHHNNLKG